MAKKKVVKKVVKRKVLKKVPRKKPVRSKTGNSRKKPAKKNLFMIILLLKLGIFLDF